MKNPNPRNIAASVHQRLLNKAQESARPFNELFQYYAIERFLYRFSRSSHAEKLILKGALMFMVWEVLSPQSTMDIDMFRGSLVRYFRFHPLRHSGASTMDQNNVPIGSIQRILGHENRTTTEIYLHGISGQEREAISVYEQARKKSHTEKQNLLD